MVNRADINSVLLQMRQVRQQIQAPDPSTSIGVNTPAVGTGNSSVGAPQNSFAAQLQQQRSQINPSASVNSSQFQNEVTHKI